MAKAYMFFGGALLAAFIYAESIGWKMMDSLMAGTFRPIGRSTFHK